MAADESSWCCSLDCYGFGFGFGFGYDYGYSFGCGDFVRGVGLFFRLLECFSEWFRVRSVAEKVGESKERVLSVMVLFEDSLNQILWSELNELDSVVKLVSAVVRLLEPPWEMVAACMTTEEVAVEAT